MINTLYMNAHARIMHTAQMCPYCPEKLKVWCACIHMYTQVNTNISFSVSEIRKW